MNPNESVGYLGVVFFFTRVFIPYVRVFGSVLPMGMSHSFNPQRLIWARMAHRNPMAGTRADYPEPLNPSMRRTLGSQDC
jgi:hypothetical protein